MSQTIRVKTLLLLVGVAVSLIVPITVSWEASPVTIPFWRSGYSITIATSMLLAVAVAFGVIAGILLVLMLLPEEEQERLNQNPTASHIVMSGYRYIAVLGVLGFAIYANSAGKMQPVTVILVFNFGSIAILASTSAIGRLRCGDVFEVQSNWGGLGGGIGGWRASPVIGLSAISVIFAAAAFAAAILPGDIPNQPGQPQHQTTHPGKK